MKLENIVIGVIAVVALVVGVAALTKSQPEPTTPPVGAISGGDIFNVLNEHAGEINSTQLSTSTSGTAITIAANDLAAWLNSSVVEYTPVTASETLTFSASSSLKNILQNAGDRQTFCIRNATTTAGVNLTFAGGTGVNFALASTTQVLGTTRLDPGKVGCFIMLRENKTASAFDIDALFTAFK
jgi:hypothetical protein